MELVLKTTQRMPHLPINLIKYNFLLFAGLYTLCIYLFIFYFKTIDWKSNLQIDLELKKALQPNNSLLKVDNLSLSRLFTCQTGSYRYSSQLLPLGPITWKTEGTTEGLIRRLKSWVDPNSKLKEGSPTIPCLFLVEGWEQKESKGLYTKFST